MIRKGENYKILRNAENRREYRMFLISMNRILQELVLKDEAKMLNYYQNELKLR